MLTDVLDYSSQLADSESTAASTLRFYLLCVVQRMDIIRDFDLATGWTVLVSKPGRRKRFLSLPKNV